MNRDTPENLGPDTSNVSIRRLPTPRTAPFVWNQLYLPAQLSTGGFDLVHSPVSPPVLLTPRTPYVVTIHDLTFEFYPETMTRFARAYWSACTRYGIGSVDAIITVSESTKRDLVAKYDVLSERVTAVPLAIDESLDRSVTDDERRDVLSQYAVKEPYLLYVGTIEPRKNLERLVRAFDRAKSKTGCDHRLVIVGKKGWLFDDVFAVVRDRGLEDTVAFTGFVPDEHLPAFYDAADGFVFPSLYEGFGLPPLEAMTYGTPVVASDSSSLPEVVGDAGVLVDPEAVDSIADGIAQLVTDPDLRADLGDRAERRARTFSRDRLADRTLEVYRETGL
jgi:glycosyltransferase involved in cell wall biosynthesis